MISFGVDPHKRSCTVAAVDALGRLLGETRVPRTAQGQARVLAWARELAPGARQWGVEGAGSYGWPLAQALLAAGERVFEVPPRAVSRERAGAIGTARAKTDATDALAAARVTAREGSRLPAVRGAGLNQQLRILSEHRDNLVSQKTRLLNQLHAQLAALQTLPSTRVGPLKRTFALAYWARVALPDLDPLAATRLTVIQQLATLALSCEEAITHLERQIAVRTAATGTPLVGLCGVSHLTAAKILGEVGDVGRFATPAKFAAYCGVAPIETSSGERRRHRLNRRGNRQLNRALHTMALVQRRCEPRARLYFERKLREGKTKREAMRCLKRQLANVVYRLLKASQGLQDTAGTRAGLT